MSSKEISFSLIIPAYNEGKGIEKSILTCIRDMEDLGFDYEIIIVDDGSQDSTVSILSKLSQKYKKVKYIENHVNLNIGVSLLRGFHFAQKEFIVFNGADLPYNLRGLSSLIDHLADNDVVVIERDNREKLSLLRKIMTVCNILLIRTFFLTKVRTYNFIQIYRRDWFWGVKNKLISRSPGFTCAEMIIRALKTKARVHVTSAPVQPREAGASHFGNPHDIFWSLYDIIRFRLRTIGKNKW